MAITAALSSSHPLLRLNHNLPSLHSFDTSNDHFQSLFPRPRHCRLATKPRTIKPSALTESDSPKSIDPDLKTLLRDLADSFVLPADYFSKLPRDLRLDLNDAAFDLSNGPVKDECGKELGEILLDLSRAWEVADASTSATLMRKLPLIVDSLTERNKSAMGERLISAGRKFQSMGSYGGGEPQKIAKAMIRAGKILSATIVSGSTGMKPKSETRTLKFGELQVELTPENAYIGAVIGVAFGVLSWTLGQGVQNVQESSLQYANDNALLLAKSLRGALIAACYSSAVLSGFASVGLVVLGLQMGSKEKGD